MTNIAAIDFNRSDADLSRHARLDRLPELVRHATHWLPAQGPITAFIHHNTLHALEHLPFTKAVVVASEVFGCQPYLSEDRYRRLFSQGRIQSQDLSAVLTEDLGIDAEEHIGPLGTRFHLRLAMLEHPVYAMSRSELRWVVSETDALQRFRPEASDKIRHRVVASTRHWIMRDLREHSSPTACYRGPYADLFNRFPTHSMDHWSDSAWEAFSLHLLWRVCQDAMKQQPLPATKSETRVRHRDWLLAITDTDSDQPVNEFLIRFCAAFLDQGFSTLQLPEREKGFFTCFVNLYCGGGWIHEPWMEGLTAELNRIVQRDMSPYDCIAESLEVLGVKPQEEETFITHTLLALRGWAGMLWQTETRGDRVVHPIPEGTIVDFLAIRLLLDRLSVKDVAKTTGEYSGSLAELRQVLEERLPRTDPDAIESRTFQLFQLAQVLGWKPEDLHRQTETQWAELLREIEQFPSVERRRIYHLAYERRYRNQTLDAILIHGQNHPVRTLRRKEMAADVPIPRFQVVCCIDDREESFRRHLEEIAPDCETFGAAGFFSVAMYYRGIADAHFQPLCPAIMKPQHYVAEEAAYPLQVSNLRRANTRRVIGTASHRVHVGSRTITGGALTAIFGSLASIPLVSRVLFPRLTAQVCEQFGRMVQPPPITHLQVERLEANPGSEEGHLGFSLDEMTNTVERLLRDLGLTTRFARVILILGHGSSSMNNPHSAAYDCGACGGGRGGPNARAFAQIANDPRVRDRLKSRGICLDHEVVFIGGFHDTGDDGVTYFDLDRLPVTHRADFDRIRLEIDQTRERNAHERCRRFESADLSLTPEAALRHVEGRTADLSQARPECGHATNAVCFVGRRSRSQGLFMDRRSFLTSYDPLEDDEQSTILTRLLQAVIPVCSGINLEYYFSYVDPTGWGCGTKLPHNVTSLLGVMDGAASDLRTGLPWQMVEIHEPMRLLFVIETTAAKFESILEKNPPLAAICRGDWVQVAVLDPVANQIHVLRNGRFEEHFPETHELPKVESSIAWYRGWREALGYAEICPDPVPEMATTPDERGNL